MDEIRPMPRIKKSDNAERQLLCDARERAYLKGDIAVQKRLTKEIHAFTARERNKRINERKNSDLFRIF